MSANLTLVDFEDIYLAVLEELKIPSADTTTLNHIKRDINIIYLNHVMPFKPRAWWWAEKNQDVQTLAQVTTGTISITNGSTTITFSSAPAASLTDYMLKVDGYEEVHEIAAHTGGATTATLRTAWVRGTISAKSFTCWKDFAALDSDMKETTQVIHEHKRNPLEAVTVTKFKEIKARNPEREGWPEIYTIGDFNSSGIRKLYWYPANDDTRYTMHVEGRQEGTALSATSDEPLMPVEDRVVLFYGAASRAWARERNESEATKNWNLFQMKLSEMAGKAGDAPQLTEMSVSSDYSVNKRYRRLFKSRRRSWRSD